MADVLSHPPITAYIVFQNTYLYFGSYDEQYVVDDSFKEIYAKSTHGSRVDNYHLQVKLLYHLGKLCIPTSEIIHVVRKAHTSLVSGHFGVRKTLCHFHRIFYWPHMKIIVTRYVKGCVMCLVYKPTNRKLGLYTP